MLFHLLLLLINLYFEKSSNLIYSLTIDCNKVNLLLYVIATNGCIITSLGPFFSYAFGIELFMETLMRVFIEINFCSGSEMHIRHCVIILQQIKQTHTETEEQINQLSLVIAFVVHMYLRLLSLFNLECINLFCYY